MIACSNTAPPEISTHGFHREMQEHRSGDRGPGPKVLLVEDDDDDALLLHMALQRAGGCALHIDRVRQLADAYIQLDDEKYDVVVTDLGLPDARGTGVVAALVAHRSQTPVVVLTGWEDASVAEKSLTLGAHDYLVKGIAEPQALRRVLEAPLDVSRRRVEPVSTRVRPGIE